MLRTAAGCTVWFEARVSPGPPSPKLARQRVSRREPTARPVLGYHRASSWAAGTPSALSWRAKAVGRRSFRWDAKIPSNQTLREPGFGYASIQIQARVAKEIGSGSIGWGGERLPYYEQASQVRVSSL